eukprot:scaffold124638_cov33-Tisochrysis_lutea.AAC.1
MAAASGDEILAFLHAQLHAKLQPPPASEGSEEATQARTEWDARWRGWMRPFERVERGREGPPMDAASLRARTFLLEDAPRILACPDFCSAAECDAFIRLGASGDAQLKPAAGWSPGWQGRQVAKRMLQMPTLPGDLEAGGEEARLVTLLAERAKALTGCDIRCSSGAGVGGSGSGDRSSGCQLTFNAPETSGNGGASIGLHVDQNNGAAYRWATIVIYLNTIEPERGGTTVFPCAIQQAAELVPCVEREPLVGEKRPIPSERHNSKHQAIEVGEDVIKRDAGDGQASSRVRVAGEELVALGLTSTSEAVEVEINDGEISLEAVESTAAAAVLCTAADAAIHHSRRYVGAKAHHHVSPDVLTSRGPDGVGLCVHPKRGCAILFYSTNAELCGDVDPFSWHGGAAVEYRQIDRERADRENRDFEEEELDNPRRQGEVQLADDGGKWTVQIFLALPIEIRGKAGATRAFLEQNILG